MDKAILQELLDYKAKQYNNRDFIESNPVSIPHGFQNLQDIEISGFFAALLSQGGKIMNIDSCRRLMDIMSQSPYDFVMHHSPHDLKPVMSIDHPTVCGADLLFFIAFFHTYYSTFLSLEPAFGNHLDYHDTNVKKALTGFHKIVFARNYPEHAEKCLPSPEDNSACKELNMYLRWMVRSDHQGVAFGLWKTISPAQLVIPLDTAIAGVAKRLGLLDQEKITWENAENLTQALRQFDPSDPVKYEYALIGLAKEFSLLSPRDRS